MLVDQHFCLKRCCGSISWAVRNLAQLLLLLPGGFSPWLLKSRYGGSSTSFGYWMGKPHGRTISLDPAALCAHFPHNAWDCQSCSYHSRGENSLPAVDFRATVYILVFLFYFFHPDGAICWWGGLCVCIFSCTISLLFGGGGWRERVVFCVKSHTILIRSPDSYRRKTSGGSVQWMRGLWSLRHKFCTAAWHWEREWGREWSWQEEQTWERERDRDRDRENYRDLENSIPVEMEHWFSIELYCPLRGILEIDGSVFACHRSEELLRFSGCEPAVVNVLECAERSWTGKEYSMA